MNRITLIIVPVGSILAYIYIPNETHNNIYITISSFINSICIFYMCPKLTYILYTTPVYYENIELMQRRTQRYYLQNYFCCFIGFTNSIFISFVAYYIYTMIYLQPELIKNYNIIELLGIFGGICNLYFKFQTYVGKGFLFILFKIKNTYEMDTISLEMFPGYYEDVGMEPTRNELDHQTMNEINELLYNSNYFKNSIVE